MNYRQDLIDIISNLKSNYDDPGWLSEALVTLSTFLIYSSEEIANAQFTENAAALGFIDNSGEKKMSVAEAEKRAIEDTKSHYKQLLLEREGVIETINSIKKRVDLLSLEKRNTYGV